MVLFFRYHFQCSVKSETIYHNFVLKVEFIFQKSGDWLKLKSSEKLKHFIICDTFDDTFWDAFDWNIRLFYKHFSINDMK